MSTPATSGPIWAQPEPAGRKPRFSREAIANVALGIADSEGFDALSMRKVAAELGAGTMTLYHYVRTKEDLVALMDDALMGEVVLASLPSGWRDALTLIARSTRDVFVRHPWALLGTRGAPPGPNGMRHFEQCLSALRETGLEGREKLELLALVDDFVFGHALRVAESRARDSTGPEATAALVTFAERQLATGNFPETAALFAERAPKGAAREISALGSDVARFERGLQAILDGAEVGMRHSTRTASPAEMKSKRAGASASRVRSRGHRQSPLQSRRKRGA